MNADKDLEYEVFRHGLEESAREEEPVYCKDCEHFNWSPDDHTNFGWCDDMQDFVHYLDRPERTECNGFLAISNY